MSITRVTPAMGTNTGATVITLTGSGFGALDSSDAPGQLGANPATWWHSLDVPADPASQPVGWGVGGWGTVAWGSHVAARLGPAALVAVNILSDTQATAIVPPGIAPGIYDVVVTRADGTQVTGAATFTVKSTAVTESYGAAGPMTLRQRITRSLRTALPSWFRQDSGMVAGLALTYDGLGGIAHIEGGRLTTTISPGIGADPLALDLADLTLIELAQQIALQPGYHAYVQDGALNDVAAATLPDGDYRMVPVPIVDILPVPRSVLASLLDTVAGGLVDAKDALDAATLALDIRTASGIWLDRWGAQWGILRLPGEPDFQYRGRLASVLRGGTVNGAAIAMQMQAAYGANLTISQTDAAVVAPSDTGPLSGAWLAGGTERGIGIFAVQGTPADITPAVQDAIDRARAAGTHPRYLVGFPATNAPASAVSLGATGQFTRN